jgi:hypothetical protein
MRGTDAVSMARRRAGIEQARYPTDRDPAANRVHATTCDEERLAGGEAIERRDELRNAERRDRTVSGRAHRAKSNSPDIQIQ